jgi:hypothetical protein
MPGLGGAAQFELLRYGGGKDIEQQVFRTLLLIEDDAVLLFEVFVVLFHAAVAAEQGQGDHNSHADQPEKQVALVLLCL